MHPFSLQTKIYFSHEILADISSEKQPSGKTPVRQIKKK
jgi:hypothetical protein